MDYDYRILVYGLSETSIFNILISTNEYSVVNQFIKNPSVNQFTIKGTDVYSRLLVTFTFYRQHITALVVVDKKDDK